MKPGKDATWRWVDLSRKCGNGWSSEGNNREDGDVVVSVSRVTIAPAEKLFSLQTKFRHITFFRP